MNEEPRSGMSGFTISVVSGIVFLLVYILSPVPMFTLVSETGLIEIEWVQPALEIIYYPIAWAAESSPAIKAFYEYQTQLCVQLGISP